MFFSKPLYLISIFTGICVFNTRGKFSFILTVWAIICLFVTSSVSLYYRVWFTLYLTNNFEFDIFSQTLPTLSLIAKVSTCSIHIAVCVVKRRDFEEVFRVLSLQKENPWHVLGVAFGGACASGILGSHLMRIYKWPPYMDEYKPYYTVDVVCLVYFSLLCYYINLQFCYLVDSGRIKISLVTQRLSQGDIFVEGKHLQITETLIQTNSLFGVQNIFNCVQAFSYMLTHSYFLSTFAKFEFVPEPDYKKALQLYIFFTVVSFYILAAVCDNSDSQVRGFNDTLFEMLRTNDNLQKNERLKLYVLMAPNVEFHACGWFSLDYSLIKSVFGATLSYVVILVQSGV